MPSNPNTDTNTHYTTKLYATTSSGTSNAVTSNGSTYLRLFDDNTARSSIKITGSGATTVSSDANGSITISSTDTNTHYTSKLVATSASGTSNASTSNGSTYLRLFDDSTARSSIKISGSGGTTVSSDSSGNITIYSPESDSSGGSSSTTTINAPTINVSTNGILTMTKSSSGSTPSNYNIYCDGSLLTTVSYTSSSQTYDLWTLVAPKGASSYSIKVKAVASDGTASSYSSAKTYDLSAISCTSGYLVNLDNHGDGTFPVDVYWEAGYYYNNTVDDMVDYWTVSITDNPDDCISSVSHSWDDGPSGYDFTVDGMGSVDLLSKYTAYVNGNRRWVTESMTVSFDYCLLENTKILMADGTLKNIQEVKSGDWLKSWDFETNDYINVRCLAAYYTGKSNEYTEYEFDDGNVLKIAHAHAIYKKSNQYPTSSKSWEINDVAVGLDNTEPHLSKINKYTSDTWIRHYSILSENNIYFANGILCGHQPSKKYTLYKGKLIKCDIEDAQLELFRTIHELAHKDVDYKKDPRFIEEARKYGRYNDLKAEQNKVKTTLAARDYKTIKRLQGVLDDTEWEENIKICESLRTEINNYQSQMNKILRHHRDLRESLGYPRNPRSTTKRWNDGYSQDMAYIRERNSKINS